MPIADITALGQLAPMMMLLGLALFFREKLALNRLLLIGAGFAGAVLVAQPGGSGFTIFAVLGFVQAVVTGLRDVILRKVPPAAPSLIVAFSAIIIVMIGAGGAHLTFEKWVMPDTRHILLLLGAGLFLRSLRNATTIDPGFDPSGLLTARMSLQGERYTTTADVNRFFDQALERIRQIPGVQAAAVVNGVPIERGLNLNVDVLDGPEFIERALTDWRYASIEYFETMRIPIVSGRAFNSGDRPGAPPVTVVNEEFARRLLKGTNPLGHHVRVFRDDGSIEIVGVAKDLREGRINGRPIPVMYVPVAQANIAGIRASHTYFPMSWVVRTTGATPDVIRGFREAMHATDPRQPFSAFATMDEVKAASMSDQTFQMILLSGLAAVGLLLAVAGIYGLMAYMVAQRSREFGIRLALGASRSRILSDVLRRGLVLASIGTVVGAAAALALNRSLQTFVYGVSTMDPLTYAFVGALLIAAAGLASFVPALRAVRLNPVAALRE